MDVKEFNKVTKQIEILDEMIKVCNSDYQNQIDMIEYLQILNNRTISYYYNNDIDSPAIEQNRIIAENKKLDSIVTNLKQTFYNKHKFKVVYYEDNKKADIFIDNEYKDTFNLNTHYHQSNEFIQRFYLQAEIDIHFNKTGLLTFKEEVIDDCITRYYDYYIDPEYKTNGVLEKHNRKMKLRKLLEEKVKG